MCCRKTLANTIVCSKTVVEVFRDTLSSTELDHVKEYCIDFLARKDMVTMFENQAFKELPLYLQDQLQNAVNNKV
jgi:hypothetical protein